MYVGDVGSGCVLEGMNISEHKSKFRMYIDESGNSDLASSTNPNHRFLSLTGVIIELDHVRDSIHPNLEALKARFFRTHPDDPVVLHRKEMINADPPFESLLDIQTRQLFDQEILNLLDKWNYTVVTVCIDKKRHSESYKTWQYDPYHYCLEVIIERYVFFLERKMQRGDILAESRGGREDMRLKLSFERLWNGGTHYLQSNRIQSVLTSRQLKIKPKSNNIAGLQLADLIAHPSKSEILNDNQLVSKLAPFAASIVGILARKYDQSGGRIFGKKLL